MAHTVHAKKKLLHRVNRIRGQVNAIAQALEDEAECATVLLTLAACRGAINALMAEILEGHVRHHVLSGKSITAEQRTAADELVTVINRYLK